MKKTKIMALLLSATLVFSGCGNMNNTAKGGLIGGGAVHATGGDKALQHILLDGHVAEEVEVLEHIAHLHPQGTNFAVL